MVSLKAGTVSVTKKSTLPAVMTGKISGPRPEICSYLTFSKFLHLLQKFYVNSFRFVFYCCTTLLMSTLFPDVRARRLPLGSFLTFSQHSLSLLLVFILSLCALQKYVKKFFYFFIFHSGHELDCVTKLSPHVVVVVFKRKHLNMTVYILLNAKQ